MKTIRPRKNWEFNASEITVWDDFFTSECLKILKYRVLYGKCCDEDYKGYQAVDYFKNKDYVSERIANDLRKKINIPAFQRAWSFVYSQNEGIGVRMHCDPSLFNLNVWISSDKSMKDKSCNGLNIYKVKPPKNWTRKEWNNGERALEYIQSRNIEPVHIPYKSNRAILFDGAYFHQTNGVSMKEGIENRRVSYTMLFGSQLE